MLFTFPTIMVYLFLSVLSFAINNVLWAKFAPGQSPLSLIAKRAVFTSLFMGLILFLAATISIKFTLSLSDIPLLFLIGLPGFMGLYFLVQGFKCGNILQFSMYSLLFTCVVGTIGEQTGRVDILGRAAPFILVALGYLHFTLLQFRDTSKTPRVIRPHLYFLAAHLFFGITLFLQWHYLTYVPGIVLGLSQEIVVMAMAFALVSFHPKNAPKSPPLSWYYYGILALPICIAVLLGLEGLRSTHPFHSAMIGLLTPITTVLLGHIWGLERANAKALPGLVIMSIGLLFFYI
ncbi:EamA family transporter [Flagellimonas marinaquae]